MQDSGRSMDDDLRERLRKPPAADGYARWNDYAIEYKIDKETGEWPVPKEGDDISPWTCDKCRYEHNMYWTNKGATLKCYRCNHWLIPLERKKKGPPPVRKK